MDWISLLVAFFYSTIKGFVRRFIPAGLTLHDDLLMLIIGYLITKYTRWSNVGTGIIYGAVTSLGSGGVTAITSLFAPPATAQTAQASGERAVVVVG